MPRSQDAIKVATPTNMKKWYVELATDYSKIMDGRYIRCPDCGQWLSTNNAFYDDPRYFAGKYYICKKCVQARAEQRENPNDPPNETKDSVKRVLFSMDIAYLDDLYSKCVKDSVENYGEKNHPSPFAAYLRSMKSVPDLKKKRWKDSIFSDGAITDDEIEPKLIRLFGKGFSSEDYEYLKNEYEDWCARVRIETKSQEMYVVQICLQALDIYKDRLAGKDTTNKVKALDTLMSGANLQPKQNIDNASNDTLTFGQLIEKWEEEKPIPEPSEEFKDVDGIGKYIRVWFMGHLAKMLGLKNAYTREYEEEIAKYTVTKPQLQEEGRSEAIYNVMFGKPEE